MKLSQIHVKSYCLTKYGNIYNFPRNITHYYQMNTYYESINVSYHIKLQELKTDQILFSFKLFTQCLEVSCLLCCITHTHTHTRSHFKTFIKCIHHSAPSDFLGVFHIKLPRPTLNCNMINISVIFHNPLNDFIFHTATRSFEALC